MFFQWKRLTIMMILTTLLLAACGNGTLEKNLIGDWKVVKDGEVELYWEIKESRMLLRTLTDEDPKSAEYILTETQDDNFVLEIIDPESGATDFLFEGYFENDDTLKSIENSEGSFELIRVDNIAEDMAKEKARAEVKRMEAKAVEEEKEEKEKAAEEEKREKEEKEKAKEEEKVKKEEKARAEEVEKAKKAEQAKVEEEKKKEKENKANEADEAYKWAEGVKEEFEAKMLENYIDSRESIKYEKYEPNGYPQGLYQVTGEVDGVENYIVVVNVKTGWYHG